MRGYQALPEERCGNCKYFRKHYLRSYKGRYRATDFGHCVHPRLKNRRAEEHCPHWTPAEGEAPPENDNFFQNREGEIEKISSFP